MSKREQGRVLAVQALYQWDVRGEDFDAQADDFLAESTQDSEVYFFARELAFGARAFSDKADEWIMKAAAHWEMNRMAVVDRNILRLAIYEMLDRIDIPPRVAIDQAIELAKRFGTAESGGFVNGILDHVLRESGLGARDKGSHPAAGHDEDSHYPDIKNWEQE
jgi:transcription antitermination factor NusB